MHNGWAACLGFGVALGGTACKRDCTKGYTLQADGTCYSERIVGTALWDTGTAEDGPLGEPSQAQASGEVRAGAYGLQPGDGVFVELWSGQNYGLYGPERDHHAPDQDLPVSAETLLTEGAVPFSATIYAIPLRGFDLFVWVRVEPAGSPTPVFFEAPSNPYVLWEDEESPSIVISLNPDGDAP